MNVERQSIFCTKCGKENTINDNFCARCGQPLEKKQTYQQQNVALYPSRQHTAQVRSVPFDYRNNCSYCGIKTSRSQRIKIAQGMHICKNCLANCSMFVEKNSSAYTIEMIRYDIERMRQYPNFIPTQTFGAVLFDANNRLIKALGYPTYRFEEIIDYDIIDERESEVVSHSNSRSQTRGGLGGALIGAAAFGPVGAVVGGMVSRRKSIVVASTNTKNKEFFNRLGIKLIVNDINHPVIFVDFFNGKIPLAKAEKYVQEVNNACAYIDLIISKRI